MLNSNKTQCIFVGSRPAIKKVPRDTTPTLDNIPVTPGTHAENLGVTMDCHMNFDIHINEMYKKVMGHLLFLNRISKRQI